MANCFRHVELSRIVRDCGNIQVMSRSCFRFGQRRFNFATVAKDVRSCNAVTVQARQQFVDGKQSYFQAQSPVTSVANVDMFKEDKVHGMNQGRKILETLADSSQIKSPSDFIHQFLIFRNLDMSSVQPWEKCSDDIIMRVDHADANPQSIFGNIHSHKTLLSSEEVKYLKINHFNIVGNNSESVQCSAERNSQHQGKNEKSTRPNEDQLLAVKENLSKHLPKLFTSMQDYKIYHKNVVFQNNIKGITLSGLAQYINYISKIRILGHLGCAYIKMDVLKITSHPEDGTIKVRWKITMISVLKIFLRFWKFKFWNIKEMIDSEGEFIDGFSIFYIGGDGLIHKHICDKVMPDENAQIAKNDKLGIKLALFFGGLVPQSSLGLGSILNCNEKACNT